MKKYLFSLLGLLLLAGCGYYETDEQEPVTPTPAQLLLEIRDSRRFVSVDEVADRMINQDPSLVLVDVRPADAFRVFSLPGAINIPLANILEAKEQERLNARQYEIVFFSNGTVEAERAWMLCRRMACPSTYILLGGLNEWTEKILNPREPGPAASAAEWELYRRRQASSQFFAGGARAVDPEPYVQPVAAQPAPKTIPVKPKKVEKEEEEGC